MQGLTPEEAPIGAVRRWAITATVMTVTVMQVLDVTVINVALPHMQGSLSAGVDEISWVLTSYLAANAVVLPATGWLGSFFGRKRFFLLCTVSFTAASVLCGIAPNLTMLLIARILQGIAGGPLMPISQAIMWEIFPFRQRGMAMAVWGMGIMMAPIFGPTLGGWITDNWSWRWVFYINVPIGILGAFAASAILFDPPYLRRPGKVDAAGLVLMVVGFLSLQLFLDQGERYEWFDSRFIITLGITAAVGLAAFLVRELTASEPVLDLGVYRDRNFAASSLIMVFVMFGFFSSMVLLALFTQKVLGYDAWTSGLVLAPGGVGNLLSLVIAGRLINRVDQRLLLAIGCLLNAWAAWSMSVLTLGVDYWGLAWPRFVQGLGVGLDLRSPQCRGPGHDPAREHGQCHRAAQRRPQPGWGCGRGARQHAPGPARPGASVDARGPRQSLRPGDGGPTVRLGHALRPAGRRFLYRAAAGHGERLPGGDASSSGPRLRRRLLDVVRSLLLHADPPPPARARAQRSRHRSRPPR